MSDSPGTLSVLMYPDSTGTNPYQARLREGLERHDVSVAIRGYGRYVSLLGGYVAHGRPDVVHLHWLAKAFVTDSSALTALLGLRLVVEVLVLRLLGVRVVWTVHNLDEHQNRSSTVERATKVVVARLATGLLVHCDRARELVRGSFRLSSDGRTPVRSVAHGHYIDSYPNDIERESARRRLGYGPGETVFLFFGLIRPYKNVTGLLETFADVADGSARLLVVGKPLSEALEATVRDWVARDERADAVLEYVPDEDIQLYMNAADTVVLPYDSVLTSGAAILAMSFSRPVIASDLGCVGDTLDPRWNFLYDPEGSGLAGALDSALGADLRRAGAENRVDCEQFDWDSIGRQTRRVYELREPSAEESPPEEVGTDGSSPT